MVRRRVSAVSNHAARLVPFILRDDALRAPQDEVRHFVVVANSAS
jgi:hypothetical protein